MTKYTWKDVCERLDTEIVSQTDATMERLFGDGIDLLGILNLDIDKMQKLYIVLSLGEISDRELQEISIKIAERVQDVADNSGVIVEFLDCAKGYLRGDVEVGDLEAKIQYAEDVADEIAKMCKENEDAARLNVAHFCVWAAIWSMYPWDGGEGPQSMYACNVLSDVVFAKTWDAKDDEVERLMDEEDEVHVQIVRDYLKEKMVSDGRQEDAQRG